MNWLARKLEQSNRSSLAVWLIFASVLLAGPTTQAQQLQQGISVKMAITANAQPIPEADNEDAWIVAVTADGGLYFGIDPLTLSDLADKMKSRPRRRDQKLYIKADERAPFAAVRRVLTAAHDVAFDGAVLLTSQPESPAPGAVVFPKGLEVHIAPPSNAATIVVQIDAGQPPVFLVNDQEIPAAALQDPLRRLLQNRSDTPVLVKTHGPVLFAPVVEAIDACQSVGAKVMLSIPAL